MLEFICRLKHFSTKTTKNIWASWKNWYLLFENSIAISFLQNIFKIIIFQSFRSQWELLPKKFKRKTARFSNLWSSRNNSKQLQVWSSSEEQTGDCWKNKHTIPPAINAPTLLTNRRFPQHIHHKKMLPCNEPRGFYPKNWNLNINLMLEASKKKQILFVGPTTHNKKNAYLPRTKPFAHHLSLSQFAHSRAI